MIKKLLPTMIGAALVGGMTAAAADVTVFGHLDLSMNHDDADTPTGSPGFFEEDDDLTMDCNTCSIGFKGSEDLGNGLAAIFKLDFQFDMDERNARGASNDSGAITDRDQWLGLKGGFGQVRFGTISTGYKSHGAMIDPLYRTSIQGRDIGLQSRYHAGAGEEDHGRSTNTVRWDSANFNGFKLVAHYQFDEGDSPTDNDDTYGIGASYSNGGILVFADWMDDQEDGTAEDQAWKIGGKYSMDAFSVMGQYESQDEGSEEEEFWHLGGSYTFGNTMLYAGYGHGESDGAGDGEYDAWSLAAMHSLSKRTKAYVGYANADCDGATGSGSINDAHPVCDDITSTGGDRTRITVGMKHKF